ncbi:plexin-A4-like [Antedon mediterranea]|uniref:plexin-A4-like n=1 Tax=Antedon mediterranea TaxID=105859 RepID=UPI003AF4C4AD
MIIQNPAGEPNLYIGTVAAIDPDLPLFATRSLVDFEVQKSMLQKSQKKASDSHIKQGFKMDFIHGFNSNNINYYVVVYDENYSQTTPNYQTYITHTCESDQTYKVSYIELPLVCNHNGQKYMLAQSAYLANRVPSEPNTSSLILVVTFGRSKNGASSIPERKSAVCVYSLSDKIEYSFLNAYKECAQGNTTFKTVQWAGSSQHDCGANTLWEQLLVDEQVPYCHYLEQIPDLGGDAPIVADAIYQEDDTLFTSVAFQYIDEVQESVIFLGDDKGDLVKLRLDSLTSAQKYETKTIDAGSSVIRNGLMLSKDNDSIYVITKQQITKVPVAECEQYTTCSECLGVGGGVGDPYCGWCTLMNRCSTYDTCSSGVWLAYNDICISIDSVSPPNLPYNDGASTLEIKFTNLPALTGSDSYLCIFNGVDVSVTRQATLVNQTLYCESPAVLPPVPEGSDHVSVTIYILSTLTQVKFIETSYDFYSCNVCSTCAASHFDCLWCTLENTCADGVSRSCSIMEDVPVNSELKCPQIASQTELEFFHTGTTKKIMIKANNLLNVSDYICVINGIDTVPATRIDDKNIICDDYKYVSDGISQEKNTTIEVVWNNTNYIDFNWKVTLYDCSVGRPDCSTCLSPLTTPPEYNCTWCNTGICVLESRCSAGQPPSCPPPIVNKILPKVVPTSAGEQYVDVITLIGQDLGQRVEDLDIDVGGKPCKNRRKTYQVGKEISCKAPSFPNAGFQSVTVMVNGNPTIVGTLEYQTPTFSSAQPSTGIMAGGTVINITGNNLNFNSVSVSIHTADCVIIRNSNKEIECKTGSIESSGCWTIIVTFGNIEFSVFEYCYRTNPNIVDYFPKESIKSGGRVVTVDGINFQYVQNAKMIVEIEDQSFESNCTDKKQKSMICNSPAVDFSSAHRKRQVNNIGGREATVRFILDSMDIDGNTNFTFFSDPVYYTFEGSTRYAIFVDEQGFYQLTDENKFLYLFGSNLTFASDERDISVFIGGIKLEVIRLTETHVEVALPEEKLKSTLVTAYHNNLYITFGEIIYLTNNINNIVLIVVRTMLLLGFLIFIAVMTLQYFFRRRKIKSVTEKEAETTL